MTRRWEGDERGRGIADAARLAPGAQELAEAMEAEGWVAEQPEAHLLPHLRRACEREDAPFELTGFRAAGGELELMLRWRGDDGDVRAIRSAAFALAGEVAEQATYVRELEAGRWYEVATGLPAPGGRFAPHGHVLALRISDTR